MDNSRSLDSARVRGPGGRVKVGDLIGAYRVDELIGVGGMGAVFRAWDTENERVVAMKNITAPFAREGQEQERIRREAAAVRAAKHPAIVELFDLVESPDGDWLVMEYIEGRTLGDHLAEGPLPLTVVVGMFRELASALDTAHRAGILHRDLKADNVMITATGRPLLLDFGLARPLWGESTSAITLEGKILGTPEFMSPEQAQGHDLDARSDLFSLGALIYAALAGRSPFASKNLVTTLRRVCLETPPPLATAVRGVPVRLSDLVQSLLEKAPDERPESAREVAEILEEVGQALGGSPAPVIDGRAPTGVRQESRTQPSGPFVGPRSGGG